jgi:hypothetical protein
MFYSWYRSFASCCLVGVVDLGFDRPFACFVVCREVAEYQGYRRLDRIPFEEGQVNDDLTVGRMSATEDLGDDREAGCEQLLIYKEQVPRPTQPRRILLDMHMLRC